MNQLALSVLSILGIATISLHAGEYYISTMLDTKNKITRYEKQFSAQIASQRTSNVKKHIGKQEYYKLLRLLNKEKQSSLHHEKLPANFNATTLSEKWKNKIFTTLSNYYSKKELKRIKWYSVTDLFEKINLNILEAVKSMPQEEQAVIKLLLISSSPPFFRAMHEYAGAICLDEKICNQLPDIGLKILCYHATCQVMDESPFKISMLEKLAEKNYLNKEENTVDSYILALTKKYVLLTAHQLSQAPLIQSKFSSFLQDELKAVKQHEVKVAQLASPKLTYFYDKIIEKINFYEKEIMPVLKAMATEQAK